MKPIPVAAARVAADAAAEIAMNSRREGDLMSADMERHGRGFDAVLSALSRHPAARVMSDGRVQRRLTAIMAADVVGFSRLMEKDEAATLAALKARRRDVLSPLIANQLGQTDITYLVESLAREAERAHNLGIPGPSQRSQTLRVWGLHSDCLPTRRQSPDAQSVSKRRTHHPLRVRLPWECPVPELGNFSRFPSLGCMLPQLPFAFAV
jgi:hypothetical protein